MRLPETKRGSSIEPQRELTWWTSTPPRAEPRRLNAIRPEYPCRRPPRFQVPTLASWCQSTAEMAGGGSWAATPSRGLSGRRGARHTRLPTTLNPRRPSRRRLNYEAGIKTGTVHDATVGRPPLACLACRLFPLGHGAVEAR